MEDSKIDGETFVVFSGLNCEALFHQLFPNCNLFWKFFCVVFSTTAQIHSYFSHSLGFKPTTHRTDSMLWQYHWCWPFVWPSFTTDAFSRISRQRHFSTTRGGIFPINSSCAFPLFNVKLIHHQPIEPRVRDDCRRYSHGEAEKWTDFNGNLFHIIKWWIHWSRAVVENSGQHFKTPQ